MADPFRTIAASLSAAALAACQAAAPEPAASSRVVSGPVASDPAGASLAGTSWRLVEFQSMDDAQGTKRPPNPGDYTVSFGTDGRGAFRLDCNRGTGTWKSAVAEPAGGSLEFGPVAMTRAMCPPGSMSDMLAAQLGYVRGFVIRDGRLAMSLMADGGIIVWEPLPPGLRP